MRIANPLYDHAFEAEYLQNSLQDEATRSQLKAEQELEDLFALQEAEMKHLRQEAMNAKAREEDERKLKEEAQEREQIGQQIARKFARLLLQLGKTPEEVARETGLSIEEVKALGN